MELLWNCLAETLTELVEAARALALRHLVGTNQVETGVLETEILRMTICRHPDRTSG